MTYRKTFALLASCIGIAALFGFMQADDDPIKKIAAQLEKWMETQPQEKVYLHMDKPYYAIGDDIWFKAYVTIGPKHQLSAFSSILNVELINDKDSVKQALKLPIVNGYSWGDFALADTLQEGTYRIRAYTNWMRNFGEEYFFDKTITIGNAISNNVFTKSSYKFSSQNGQQRVETVINYSDLNGSPYVNKNVSYDVQLNFRSVAKGKAVTDEKGNITVAFANTMPTLLKSGRIITSIKVDDKKTVNKTVAIKATSDRADLQFFPEGGNLVAGLRSKVAFKAVGADGLGVEVSGTITDNENKEIANFKSQHLGMGMFAMTSEPGKTYKAQVRYPDGSTATVALPRAVNKGYVMNITNSNPENIFVRVTTSAATLAETPNAVVSLIAHSGGNILFAAKSNAQTPTFSANIPKSRFPTGIVQFTLFNAAGEPLNERIVFVQNPDLLTLNVNVPQTSAPRQKVTVNLNAKNKENKAVTGSFSVAVIDESKINVDETTESTILSNLLLTSDIKGYVEKPNYYFTNVNEKTQADLDVLMMTQGYRRFEWRRLMSDTFTPIVFQPEKSLAISGTIKTANGKSVVPRAKVMLFSTSGGAFVLDTVADAQGRFNFNNLLFADSVKFLIQARTEKNKNNVEIELDNIAPQIVTANKNAPDVEVTISDAQLAYVRNSKRQFDEMNKYGLGNRTIVLKEVTIKEKKQTNSNSSNLNGAGNADQVLTSKDLLQGCSFLSQCLQGRLLGVIFRNGIPYSTRSINTPMQLIVDGMYMEPDFLDQLVVTDIETIEVLRRGGSTAIYGSRGGGGVIIVTTKRGGGDASYAFKGPSPGVLPYTPRGYYRSRTFYSPRYDDPKTNTQMADLRSTIFWKPDIITDKDGNASFDFFNADTRGTYRIVVEGIDGDGNLGRQVYRYKVQ